MRLNTAQQEIINTPEAKGMRLLPSSRGVNINFSRLKSRRVLSARMLRPLLTGHVQNADEYLRHKTDALSSPEAARQLQLLQADPQATEIGGLQQPLRLPTEFAGLDDNGLSPNDCHIAAGPNHLLVVVNASLAIFEKSGRQLQRCNLTEIFSPVVEGAIFFNPKVIFDKFHGAWVFTCCAQSDDGRQSWILLARSHSSDPLAGWWIWALDVALDGGNRTGHTAYLVGLAVDNNALYLTANMFGGQGQFLYAKLRVLSQKELQVGGVLHGWDFWELRDVDGTLAFSIQPAINLRAAGTQYLLNATNNGQGLTLWSFTETLRQNPTLSRRLIPTVSYQLAPDAKQPLTSIEIKTGDTRLGGVVFRHGMLWAAHTVAANWGDDENVAAIQWFQINPRAGCVIHQSIYGAPHFNYFSPALMIDGEGNLTMVFNRSGETEFPSIRFTGRRPSDELNLLHPSSLLQRGITTGSSDWAQFNSASIAPEEARVWIMGQYAATEHDWATWIGAVSFAEIEETRNLIFDRDIAAA